jgi:hypothetical protein
MAKLTEKRLADAAEVLEKYRNWLQQNGEIYCPQFEKELRDCWDTGYQTIKTLILELSEIRRFRFLAAYYMEHIYPGGPASEFKGRLAEMYGVPSYHYSQAMTEKREAFWSGLAAPPETDDE